MTQLMAKINKNIPMLYFFLPKLLFIVVTYLQNHEYIKIYILYCLSEIKYRRKKIYIANSTLTTFCTSVFTYTH